MKLFNDKARMWLKFNIYFFNNLITQFFKFYSSIKLASAAEASMFASLIA
jgi:hypothetical protein